MNILDSITSAFVSKSRNILGDNLVGIYLHGSAVMGCFNEKTSDIDLLVVVDAAIPNDLKIQYMEMVVELNKYAPTKGIEFSIIKKSVCKPFIYPTPYELHFSVMHLQWFTDNPCDYVNKMNGTDKDIAAHVVVIYHRGQCLYGKEISEIFEDVNKNVYFDSIRYDIQNAVEEITKNPTYIILNLCRVLAYKKNGLILSKKEGGDWGIHNLPDKYHSLILQALGEYTSDKPVVLNHVCAYEYAIYMLDQIK